MICTQLFSLVRSMVFPITTPINRLNTKANHIAWLTGSLVQQRHEIATSLGADRKQAAHELFDNNKGIQDNITYPSLAEFKKDWESITPL